MFTRSHFSLKLPTYVETIFTRQLHDLIVTKLCQNPGDGLYMYIVSIEERNIGYRVVVFVFLGLPKMQCSYVMFCGYVDEKLIIALHIPRWPLDQSEHSVLSS